MIYELFQNDCPHTEGIEVVIFLYELDLPWEMKIFDRTDPDVREKEPMVSLTPNGRMPVLEDPNTGLRIWEVCSRHQHEKDFGLSG